MNNLSRELNLQLSDWYGSDERKPLLLRGARQVGKSFAIRDWCARTGLKLLEVNFEERPRLATIFDQDLDVRRISSELSSIFGVSPLEKGHALFLDEIQKAPKAIAALRYFYEKTPEATVLAAGSLIEFALENEGLPVGRIHSQFVYPLTFVEFLDAIGREGLANIVRQFLVEDLNPIPMVIHEELLAQLAPIAHTICGTSLVYWGVSGMTIN